MYKHSQYRHTVVNMPTHLHVYTAKYNSLSTDTVHIYMYMYILYRHSVDKEIKADWKYGHKSKYNMSKIYRHRVSTDTCVSTDTVYVLKITLEC